MASPLTLQLLLVPHRPVPALEEVLADFAPAFGILEKAHGLQALWRGKKFEDRYTLVYLILWQDLASSHAFFTSTAYRDFNKLVQPALNGRKIEWQQHALLDRSSFSTVEHLRSILTSGAIEVALTKVVEGSVHDYYEQFAKVVDPILRDEPGADGHFISPLIENPQDQLLLINWKSVDAHHQEFEKRPGFKNCIDALFDYYAVFVVPWHITELELLAGAAP